MVSPLNPGNLDAFQRRDEARKRRAEGQFARQLAAEFRAVAKENAEAFEQGLPLWQGEQSQRHAENLTRIVARRAELIASAWAGDVQRAAKSALVHERKDYDDNIAQWVRAYMAQFTARKVTGISNTTREQILRSIRLGIADELGTAQIARLIQQRSGVEFGRFRAATIARTETNSVANGATRAGIDALGIQATKRWVPASDARTRATHRAMSSHPVIALDEKFTVGDSVMDRPGDPAGSAAEVINCRCALAYRTREGD